MSTEPAVNKAWLQELEAKYSGHELTGAMGRALVAAKKLTTQPEKRAVEQAQKVDAMLDEICRVEAVTSTFVKAVNLKVVLDTMRTSKVLKAKGFSDYIVNIAEEQYQRFDGQGWGTLVTPAAPPVSTIASPLANGSRKRKHDDITRLVGTTSSTSSVPAMVATTKSSRDNTEIKFPSANHPVYGLQGVLRGIVIRRNKTTGRTSFLLDPRSSHKRADYIGKGDLEVGQCWPRMLCLVRDGVHGSTQAGIYGNEESGAYSIIVHDSAYTKLDRDDDVSGDTLWYSGPGSVDNTNADQPAGTEGTKALQTSNRNGKSVRVIRGKSTKEIAPKLGYRYDGLYRVTKQEEDTNDLGGAYLRFKLVRCEDQDAIAKDRPTAEEVGKFLEI